MAKRTKKELRGPKIVSVPPGPKSKAAMARKEKFVTNAVKVALPIDVTFAEGPFVQDADGNVYVDLGGGIGVQTAGHRPPSVIRAAKDELDRLTHISFMVATYGPYTELAARMAEICPPGLTKSIFLNSGSEAVENAVKISRAATKRAWLVSFKTAFHGRTLLDISLTGKDKPYREGFGPLVREVILADYAYPYRDPQGVPPAPPQAVRRPRHRPRGRRGAGGDGPHREAVGDRELEHGAGHPRERQGRRRRIAVRRRDREARGHGPTGTGKPGRDVRRKSGRLCGGARSDRRHSEGAPEDEAA